MVSWVGLEITRNYREGGEFRRRILWQNFALLVLFVVPWVVLCAWFSRQVGHRALFTILAIYIVPLLDQGRGCCRGPSAW